MGGQDQAFIAAPGKPHLEELHPVQHGRDRAVGNGLQLQTEKPARSFEVTLPDGKTVKARELSGANNLLFRRNSQSGALEVLPKTGDWGGLNSVLHAN